MPYPIMSKYKYDIFISYSRQDLVIADKICTALDRAGISYFLDRQSISGGMEFPNIIAENISSSRLFLFLASKHSYESKFTNSEITFAFNEKPKNSILPYIIDSSQMPKSMRFIFSGINWRTIENHPIEPVLINDILQLLGRESLSPRNNYTIKKSKQIFTNTTKRLRYFIFSLIIVGIILFLYNLSIRIKYDHIHPFNEGIALVELNNKVGFINIVGKEITPIMYDGASVFNEGLAIVEIKGKSGFINKTGEEIIALKYDDAQPFQNNLALVKLNGKFGYIDKAGNEVISIKYDNLCGSFSEGLVPGAQNGKWGFIDRSGNEVINCKYDSAGFFIEGLANVELNNKYGFIDNTDKIIIPFKYDYAGYFSEGLAPVKTNGKFGFIDNMGNEVINCIYDDVNAFNRDVAKVKINDIWFYIDKNGNRVTK